MRMGEVGYPQRTIEVVPESEPVRRSVPEQIPATPATPATPVPAEPVPAEPALVP